MDHYEYIETRDEITEINNSLLDDVGSLITANIATEAVTMDSRLLELMADVTDYELSSEASDVAVFKSRLATAQKELSSLAQKKFKQLKPLVDKSGMYKRDKLIKAKEDILSGKLVPVTEIDNKKSIGLKSKLGVMYASNYSISNGASGLTSFISGIVSLAGKNSKYLKGIESMSQSLGSYTKETEINKLGAILNVKKGMKGLLSSTSRKIVFTDFRLSIVNKWISNSIDLIVIKYHTKTGIKVGLDKYSTTASRDIGLPKEKETLKLLELGIEQTNILSNANTAISLVIKRLLLARNEGLLSTDNKKRLIIAKYNEYAIYSFINLYSDLAVVDDLILQYVNLTYKRK